MSGFGDEIDVILNTDKNMVTVIDQGRGIPLDIHPDIEGYQAIANHILDILNNKKRGN